MVKNQVVTKQISKQLSAYAPAPPQGGIMPARNALACEAGGGM